MIHRVQFHSGGELHWVTQRVLSFFQTYLACFALSWKLVQCTLVSGISLNKKIWLFWHSVPTQCRESQLWSLLRLWARTAELVTLIHLLNLGMLECDFGRGGIIQRIGFRVQPCPGYMGGRQICFCAVPIVQIPSRKQLVREHGNLLYLLCLNSSQRFLYCGNSVDPTPNNRYLGFPLPGSHISCEVRAKTSPAFLLGCCPLQTHRCLTAPHDCSGA